MHSLPEPTLVFLNDSTQVLCELKEKSETGDIRDLIAPEDVVLPRERRELTLSAYAREVLVENCAGSTVARHEVASGGGLFIQFRQRAQTESRLRDRMPVRDEALQPEDEAGNLEGDLGDGEDSDAGNQAGSE